MTGLTDAENAIRQRLDTQWTTTTKVFENAKYEPGTDPYVFLEVKWGLAIQASIGDPTHRKFRHPGLIMVHVFVPMNSGTGLALQYADSICAIFRAADFSGVLCFTPRVQKGDGPADDQGRWYRATVFCDFQYDKDF